MVVALGLNPAIDRILIVPGFAVERTLKAIAVETLPSGKGANVAAVMRFLGVPARYAGFVGRAEADAYRARLAGVPCDLTEIDGRTRIDTTIIDPDRSETHVREPGFAVTPADVDAFVDRLAAMVAPGDLVMMSGSLPPGADDDTYARCIRAVRRKDALAFLDTSGDALRIGAEEHPDFMKPNREELAELVGHDAGGDDRATVGAARELIATGIRAVAVSLGAEGALLVDAESAWRGIATAPDVVNTVGSGDAFACGWIAARIAGLPPDAQLREALALGAANAMSHGAGVIRSDHLALMRERARVQSSGALDT